MSIKQIQLTMSSIKQAYVSLLQECNVDLSVEDYIKLDLPNVVRITLCNLSTYKDCCGGEVAKSFSKDAVFVRALMPDESERFIYVGNLNLESPAKEPEEVNTHNFEEVLNHWLTREPLYLKRKINGWLVTGCLSHVKDYSLTGGCEYGWKPVKVVGNDSDKNTFAAAHPDFRFVYEEPDYEMREGFNNFDGVGYSTAHYTGKTAYHFKPENPDVFLDYYQKALDRIAESEKELAILADKIGYKPQIPADYDYSEEQEVLASAKANRGKKFIPNFTNLEEFSEKIEVMKHDAFHYRINNASFAYYKGYWFVTRDEDGYPVGRAAYSARTLKESLIDYYICHPHELITLELQNVDLDRFQIPRIGAIKFILKYCDGVIPVKNSPRGLIEFLEREGVSLEQIDNESYRILEDEKLVKLLESKIPTHKIYYSKDCNPSCFANGAVLCRPSYTVVDVRTIKDIPDWDGTDSVLIAVGTTDSKVLSELIHRLTPSEFLDEDYINLAIKAIQVRAKTDEYFWIGDAILSRDDAWRKEQNVEDFNYTIKRASKRIPRKSKSSQFTKSSSFN